LKLSVCVIARDEEQNLAATLESVKSIADEIVVVDTGSSDGTLETAKRFTDNAFVHPKADEWREHPDLFEFHTARNYAIEQCTGDWIFSVDCDEALEQNEALSSFRNSLAKLPSNIDLVMPTIVMLRDDNTVYQEFLAERVFRNRSDIRFDGAMHNWLTVKENAVRAQAPHIRLLHNRAVKSNESRKARGTQRVDMAERIFKEKIAADPNDARSMFYLAGTYYDACRYEEAVEWFEQYFGTTRWLNESYQAAVLCAQAYLNLGKRGDAERVLRAHNADNYQRAECDIMLGELAEDKGDFEQAEHWYKVASLKPPKPDPLFVERDAHTWMPHSKLWQLNHRLGNDELALFHGNLALEAGTPHPGVILRHKKSLAKYEGPWYALVDRGQMDFIQPLVDAGWFAGTFDKADDVPQDAGLVWCEWAGDEAIKFCEREKTCRIVVRVHGYEVHNGNIGRMDWLKVDDAIFVANYLRDHALAQSEPLREACNIYVVPGGVEAGKFTIGVTDAWTPENAHPMAKDGTKIAMACYGNYKKNFQMALQILAKLPSEYTLHIATEWQDDRLAMYIDNLIGELALGDRVFLYPWQDDLNAFYADKDAYLSCSIEESFHYSLAEGMAAGLKPVIHCWKSARDFYKPEWIFRTVDEAVGMILAPCEPEAYRQYAVENLDVKRNLKRIRRILDRPVVAVSGEPRYPDAAENKIGRALAGLGCKVNESAPAVVIVMGNRPVIEPWMDGAKKLLWLEDVNLYNDEDYLREITSRVDMVIVQNPSWMERVRLISDKAYCLPIIGACDPFSKLAVEKQYDVGFYGVLTERRNKILEELGQSFDVTTFSSFDHQEINRFANQCKLIVNIHAYEEPIVEWRLTEMLAAGACVVSEWLPPNNLVGVTETEDLAGTIRRLLADDAERESLAKAGHDWVWREMRLDQQVEKLLDLAEIPA
jgi:glycosyltransferase involved in cell wall biosynthesis